MYVISVDGYADVGTYWIALFWKKLKFFISIVSVLNMFLKKLKNFSEIKTSKQTLFEYNQTIDWFY